MKDWQKICQQIEQIGKLGWWEMDWETKEVFWSNGFHEILGTDPKTFQPMFKDGFKFLTFESQKILENLIKNMNEEKFVTGDYELQTQPNAGKSKWVLFSIRSRIEDFKLIKIFGTLRDITEEVERRLMIQKINDELKSQNQRTQLAKKSVGFGIWDWDVKSLIVTWDEELYRLYGLIDKIGQDPNILFKDVVESEDYNFLNSKTVEAFKRHQKQYEVQYRLKTNPVRYIKTVGRIYYDSNQNPERVLGFSWDVTNEVEIQNQIKEQQTQIIASAKMVSLGEMAGNMAHEINNPLAIISSRIGLMKMRLQKNPEIFSPIEGDLDVINSTVKRIATIIKGLRSFTRDSSSDPLVETSLIQIIEETLSFCQSRLNYNGIKLNLEIENDYLISCRPSQISQILLNLIQNSMEAVIDLNEKWIVLKLSKNLAGKIELSITDSGVMPKSVAEKAMSPFFTTKPQGKGTGIGLSICKNLAAANNVKLQLAEFEPHNTKFILIFN